MYFIRDRKIAAASKNNVIGLDIATAAIKCVVLSDLGSSYHLTHYCIEANSIAHENNSVKTGAELVTSIKRMLARAEIAEKKCILALPDALVNSKWVRIDRSATENIEIAINLAVEKHIPYPPEAIYFDSQVFEVFDQNYLNVFLVACRKEQLDVRLEAIYQANLIPLFIEVNSHALQRAYTYLYPEHDDKSSLLLAIDTNHLTFLFLDKGRQIHSYSETVANFFVKAIINKIHIHIKRFYLSYPYIKLNKFFLMGSNLQVLRALAKNFGDFYGLNVEIVGRNQLLSCAKNLNEKKLDELFPSLVLSYGLALRGFMPCL